MICRKPEDDVRIQFIVFSNLMYLIFSRFIQCELNSPTMSGLNYEQLAAHSTRNENVSCEIQGCIESKQDMDKKTGTPYAIATLEGSLIMARDDKVIWSIQTKRQLFSLHKLDLNSDGNDEIIVTSWSGHVRLMSITNSIIFFININTFRPILCLKT